MQFCQMLKKVKQRWGVNNVQFWLIICTFALGGSACARIGKKLLDLWGMNDAVFRIPAYLILITILWPFCVIVFSIPLGQFRFFKNYLKRVYHKITGQ